MPFLTTLGDPQKKHFFNHISNNLRKDIKINALHGFYPAFCRLGPYEEVIQASKMLKERGVKKYTANQIKVVLYTLKANDTPIRDAQETDEFIEIETGLRIFWHS